jgi:hypothetical protein
LVLSKIVKIIEENLCYKEKIISEISNFIAEIQAVL